jgi:hypothetical protein
MAVQHQEAQCLHMEVSLVMQEQVLQMAQEAEVFGVLQVQRMVQHPLRLRLEVALQVLGAQQAQRGMVLLKRHQVLLTMHGDLQVLSISGERDVAVLVIEEVVTLLCFLFRTGWCCHKR